MNLLQLVLTLVLVAGGIFVYDTFVADDPQPVTPDAPPVEVPVTRAPEPEPEMRVDLPGAGVDCLVSRIDDLEARLAESLIEARERRPDSVGGGLGPAPGEFRVEDVEEGEEPEFDERDLAWFRAMKEEVDRRQRQERFEQMISGQLDRTGVELTGEQRQGVVKATLDYRAKIRETYRQEDFRAKTPEVRQQAL